MVTDYVYDSNGIMTDILHKSGSTVKQGFSYLYDDVYNIERVTHEDGSYWTYGYDNRYRLTSAVRHNAGDTIQASYGYAYDSGDNMTSKTEPWVDDFNDGSLSVDWNGSSATDWPVTAGEARNVVGGSNRLMWKTNTDADNELRFRYVNYDTGSAAKNLFASGRYTSAGDRVGVMIRPDCLLVQQYVASTNTWTTLDSDLTATSTQGQHYDIRMEMDGANVKVWRDGALVLESTAATVTATDTVRLQASANAAFGVDNVMFLASGISRTTTMTHRANNEIDQVTDYNGTASYTFDAWGRTSTEAKNGITRTYSWTSANLLAGIDSSDTNETDVGYFYTGDLKRIWRMENAALNNIYTWDAGFNVISEAATGNPLKTFVPVLAEVIGNDLSTSADYRYLTTDHLGSTRGMWNGSIAQTGSWEFTPYGSPFNFAGPDDVTQLFTGHDLDKVTGQHYAPFRYLNAGLGRWASQDMLRMVDGTNMYILAFANPTNFVDLLGLLGEFPFGPEILQLLQLWRNAEESKDKSIFWFYNQVRNKGPKDYKQTKLPGAENFGNVNFGSMGTSLGLSPNFLKRGAGWAQWQAGTSKPEFGSPWGGPPYGDDPLDQAGIDRGIVIACKFRDMK